MAKQKERTARTKQILMDSFWSLYCENNIEKITVKSITDKAGFYRSTFYEYFSDVYSVLEEIENDMLKLQMEAFNKVYETDNIQDAQKIGLRFLEDNADYLAVLLGPNGDRKYYENLKSHIEEVLENKIHIKKDNPKIQIAFQVFSNSIISLLTYWYDNKEQLSLQEVFKSGLELLQHGTISYMQGYGIPFFDHEIPDKKEKRKSFLNSV